MTNNRTPPKFDDAPGLTLRPNGDGWEARWRPRGDLVKRGYTGKAARLWVGIEPSAVDRQYVSGRCNVLQSEMLTWGRGGIPSGAGTTYDGTLKALIACYRTDVDSPYRKLRYRTRIYYDGLCRRIEHDCGGESIAAIKSRQLLRWHEGWAADDKIAMGHAVVGMLRTLLTFGATILDDPHCRTAKVNMHDMRFAMGKPRTERLTAEQVIAIRSKAHEMGWHSLALAQAMQFELMLRQKDVIGEWVPLAEPGTSDVTTGNWKWLRGIRWSEIDENLVLRHTTSKRQKDLIVGLRNAPMVMEEFERIGALPTSGPIIVSELHGVPWVSNEFRRQWRKVADAAGVPKTVRNMDSRAGAISEATDAGAELEHVRHAATHSDIGMTQRYSRGSVEKIENVQLLRVAHRNKS